MPRTPLVLALLALTVSAPGPAWPQTPMPKTLAPGKPASVKAAQHISYGDGFIGLSIVAVALTFALPASSTSTTATSAATTS